MRQPGGPVSRSQLVLIRGGTLVNRHGVYC